MSPDRLTASAVKPMTPSQLDRNPESYIALIEHRLLKELQNAMCHESAHKWIAVFMAIVLILHTRETYISGDWSIGVYIRK
jgi:hypothetical protein